MSGDQHGDRVIPGGTQARFDETRRRRGYELEMRHRARRGALPAE